MSARLAPATSAGGQQALRRPLRGDRDRYRRGRSPRQSLAAGSETVTPTPTFLPFFRDPAQPGDQILFVTELSQRGKHVGNSPHHCTVVSADYTVCEAAADLPGGELTFQTQLGPHNGGDITSVAVTGGTGIYRGAHGQLVITALPDGSATWSITINS